MIADRSGELAATILTCWLCGVLILVLMSLAWPLLKGLRFRSRPKAACYGDSMSQHEGIVSFREWLLQPIIHRIEHILATSLDQLNVVIAANTAETALAVKAISANVSGDFTPQAQQIAANTAALAAVVPNTSTNPPPAGAIAATPALVALSATVPTQVVTLVESNGQPNTFNAVSNNTAIATVSPASGAGPFTINRIGAGIGATVTFTDAQNNSVVVAVSAS